MSKTDNENNMCELGEDDLKGLEGVGMLTDGNYECFGKKTRKRDKQRGYV